LARSSFTSDFTKGDSALDDWKITAGEVTTGPDGAEFTIRKQGDAPTIQTPWYFFFGKVEIEMKIAPGQGIVSSSVMQSSVLDEVDWVWLTLFRSWNGLTLLATGRTWYPKQRNPVQLLRQGRHLVLQPCGVASR
jgi:hypothetical protein